jgi:hypothetical protein
LRPHDELVYDIKAAIAQARQSYEAENKPFDPASWLSRRLTESAVDDYWRKNKERLETLLVWDSISYPFMQDEEYQYAASGSVLASTAGRRDNIVRLTPEGAKLIDAMAEAAGIPHTRGRVVYDLLPTPDRKQSFRAMYTKIAREMGL